MNKICFGCDHIGSTYDGDTICNKADRGRDDDGYAYYNPSCIHDSTLPDLFSAEGREETFVKLNATIKNQYTLLSDQRSEIYNLKYKIDKLIS